VLSIEKYDFKINLFQSQLYNERGHDPCRLAGLEPAQLRGWGPQHCRQSHQGNGHGEDAQGARGHMVGYGLSTRSCKIFQTVKIVRYFRWLKL